MAGIHDGGRRCDCGWFDDGEPGSRRIGSSSVISEYRINSAGTYYKVVVDLDDGTRSTEYWVVPQVPQTTIAAVRSSLVPQSQAMQFVGRDYVDSAIASVGGKLWRSS